MSRIVLDTNVLVSSFLKRTGNPARLRDLVMEGRVTLLVDDRVLAEYRDVLFRPRFGLDQRDVEDVLAFIQAAAEHIVAAPCNIPLPDESDRPFLEVAISGVAIAIVTGNRKHFPEQAGVPVLTPAEFLGL